MDDAELEDVLRQFGFSEKEVDTYLTILGHGEAKAATIADAADVSKRYVYSVSEELEKRGFVTVNDHIVPTTIEATPPEQVIASLKETLDRLQPALENRYTAATSEYDQFEVIKSRVTVIDRLIQRIDEADEEIAIAVPQQRLSELAESLSNAVSRGVLVVLVVSNVSPEEPLDVDGVATVARAWAQPMPTMVTADRRSGLVAPTEMVTRSTTDRQAIAFTQQQLGPVIVGSFFGNYWLTAEEVHVADPDELPRTYHDFRDAVLQATLYRRQNRTIEAIVEGRIVGSDDEGTVELIGEIVETRQGLVTPVTNTFPVENAFLLETDDGTYSVGGEGAFVEDVEAVAVTLRLGEA